MNWQMNYTVILNNVINVKYYMMLDNKTGLKGTFFEKEIFT